MDRNERRLTDEINRLLKRLEMLIYNNFLAAMNLFQVKGSLSGDRPFWFSRNAAADRQMNRLTADFEKQTEVLFLNGIERSWKLGEESFTDKMHLALSGKARQRKYFDEMRERATQQQRESGARASAVRFAEQERNGMNLSGRVWNLGEGMKREIEIIVQNGMKEGKSAQELSRELRGYLNEPDKLFRRVRNKDTGELELSEAARKYRPGRGVYRSSYRNAMRLARTEITAAYRRAQWEKFRDDPQVTGIHIGLSNNHTCINPKTGKAEPFYDICDELAGDYPKTFLGTGWHPQCRCVQTPILAGAEDFRRMVDAEVRGEKYEAKQITEPPKALNDWLIKNQERIENAKQLPYWISDNYKNFNISNVLKNASNPETKPQPTPIPEKPQVKETDTLYPKVEKTENEIRMNKRFETAVVYDKNGNIVLDKRGAATSVSFTADEVLKMKDGIFTHNHPRGWEQPENSLLRIGSSFSPEDINLAIKANVSEIRAVTPHYTFVMKRPENGWGIDAKTVFAEIDKIRKDMNKEFDLFISKTKDRETAYDRINAIYFHRANTIFAKKYGIEYTKKKTR
jgi:hypothetical protein